MKIPYTTSDIKRHLNEREFINITIESDGMNTVMRNGVLSFHSQSMMISSDGEAFADITQSVGNDGDIMIIISIDATKAIGREIGHALLKLMEGL